MENSNSKKKQKTEESSSSDLGHALRSSGMLLPISDDEIKSFKELYGELNEDLPERFNNVDFLFESSTKSKIVEITNFEITPEEARLAYAARDGQEKLPEHILDKMRELKNGSKSKRQKGSN